ncbi:MAG: diacylglycerol kinase family lipid kinase [Verrucomicrobia bacterium]|nr:diacylglycerol kinase family lipid kinase [Verrucomicrobiota bacterium]
MNPAARGDRAGKWLAQVRALSERVELWPTEAAGDARRLARRAVDEGRPVVVAAGGDGTINEVVNGLAGSSVALGLLPLGTMNVFASELGLPSNKWAECWRIIEAGRTRNVDLPTANGRHFIQLAGIGFDAQAVAGVDRDDKRALGPLSYLLSASSVLSDERPPVGVVVESADGRRVEGRFALVGNGRFYGGKLPLFKRARLDDGLLDIVVFKRLSHFDLLRYFRGVVFAEHDTFTDVEYFQTPGARIAPAVAGARIPFELDGELAGEAPVELSMQPGALKVLA